MRAWPDSTSSVGKLALTGSLVLLMALLCVAFIAPISDIDIWWHLASGRWILETGQLPGYDPFGLAGSDITPGREYALTSSWLGQLLLYCLHAASEERGLIIARVLVLLVPVLTILAHGWLFRLQFPVILLLAALVGWSMTYVSGFRPNHFTVALLPVLMMLLERVGQQPNPMNKGPYIAGAALLPLLMLLWANLHGGFLLGIAILGLFVLGETLHAWRHPSGHPIKALWLITALAMIFAMIRPDGTAIIQQYLQLQGSILQQRTSEYMAPLTLATSGMLVYWPYFIFAVLSAAVLLVRRLKVGISRLMIFSALFALSITAFRYAPLFVAGCAILLARDFNQLYNELKASRVITQSALAGTLLLLGWSEIPNAHQKMEQTAESPIDKGRFPIQATKFYEQQHLSGNVFTHFNWGGYLSWQQPVGTKTFIDGRSLNETLFHEYTRVLWLPTEAKGILDHREVDVILVPRLNPFTHELYALTDFVWKSPDWVLVFRDQVSMLLVRSGKFPELEARMKFDKSTIYQDVLADVSAHRQAQADDANLNMAEQRARMRLRQIESVN